MPYETGRPTPAAEAPEALLALRCQALLAAASGWLANPDDEAIEGARTLVSLLRLRAAQPPPPRLEGSFDEYVDRLVGVIRRFAQGGAPPGSLPEAARYGHLRARAAGLRTQGDVALWVALQAALGRNFQDDEAHASLVEALVTGSGPADDELREVRASFGPSPPPRRPPWHPPTPPW